GRPAPRRRGVAAPGCGRRRRAVRPGVRRGEGGGGVVRQGARPGGRGAGREVRRPCRGGARRSSSCWWRSTAPRGGRENKAGGSETPPAPGGRLLSPVARAGKWGLYPRPTAGEEENATTRRRSRRVRPRRRGGPVGANFGTTGKREKSSCPGLARP